MTRLVVPAAVTATAMVALLGFPPASPSATEEDALGLIRAEITRRHDEGVRRLQDWVRQPSTSAPR